MPDYAPEFYNKAKILSGKVKICATERDGTNLSIHLSEKVTIGTETYDFLGSVNVNANPELQGREAIKAGKGLTISFNQEENAYQRRMDSRVLFPNIKNLQTVDPNDREHIERLAQIVEDHKALKPSDNKLNTKQEDRAIRGATIPGKALNGKFYFSKVANYRYHQLKNTPDYISQNMVYATVIPTPQGAGATSTPSTQGHPAASVVQSASISDSVQQARTEPISTNLAPNRRFFGRPR